MMRPATFVAIAAAAQNQSQQHQQHHCDGDTGAISALQSPRGCQPTALPAHPSLVANAPGQIIFWSPNSGRSGGPADMYAIHHLLLEQGIASAIYAANQHYMTNTTRLLSQTAFQRLWLEGLAPADVLIIPEVATPGHGLEEALPRLVQRGGKILKWVQGEGWLQNPNKCLTRVCVYA